MRMLSSQGEGHDTYRYFTLQKCRNCCLSVIMCRVLLTESTPCSVCSTTIHHLVSLRRSSSKILCFSMVSALTRFKYAVPCVFCFRHSRCSGCVLWVSDNTRDACAGWTTPVALYTKSEHWRLSGGLVHAASTSTEVSGSPQQHHTEQSRGEKGFRVWATEQISKRNFCLNACLCTKDVPCFQELVQKHCKLAVHYTNELNKWAKEDYYMQNVHVFELPHTLVSKNRSCGILAKLLRRGLWTEKKTFFASLCYQNCHVVTSSCPLLWWIPYNRKTRRSKLRKDSKKWTPDAERKRLDTRIQEIDTPFSVYATMLKFYVNIFLFIACPGSGKIAGTAGFTRGTRRWRRISQSKSARHVKAATLHWEIWCLFWSVKNVSTQVEREHDSLTCTPNETDFPFQPALKKLGFSSPADLQMGINKLNNSINKLNNKILAEETEAPDTPPKPKKAKSVRTRFRCVEKAARAAGENLWRWKPPELKISNLYLNTCMCWNDCTPAICCTVSGWWAPLSLTWWEDSFCLQNYDGFCVGFAGTCAESRDVEWTGQDGVCGPSAPAKTGGSLFSTCNDTGHTRPRKAATRILLAYLWSRVFSVLCVILYFFRQELLDKRAQRKQHKADMAKRRTLASQQRMKIITELASELLWPCLVQYSCHNSQLNTILSVSMALSWNRNVWQVGERKKTHLVQTTRTGMCTNKL